MKTLVLDEATYCVRTSLSGLIKAIYFDGSWQQFNLGNYPIGLTYYHYSELQAMLDLSGVAPAIRPHAFIR